MATGSTREYPQVQRFTAPMLAVFSEMARMHSAYLHEAVPPDVYESSMQRCDRVLRIIEERIAASVGEPALQRTA
jgi:hypothetical protein